MQAITTVNPAAVLGASLNYIRFDDRPTCSVQAYRDSKRTAKMSGSLFIKDLSTVLRIKSLPNLAGDFRIQDWDHERMCHFVGLDYTDVVAIVGEMYRHGVRPADPLLCEQAQVASTGRVPLDYRAAYDQFVLDADRVLTRIDAMRLPELAKTKGIRTTVSPRRARSLTSGAKGIHVAPDLYHARYVRVFMYGLDEATGYLVRDLAHDHYEGQGLRVQVFHA